MGEELALVGIAHIAGHTYSCPEVKLVFLRLGCGLCRGPQSCECYGAYQQKGSQCGQCTLHCRLLIDGFEGEAVDDTATYFVDERSGCIVAAEDVDVGTFPFFNRFCHAGDR